MTQKELLYVEDAICHEQTIIKILENTAKELKDEKLIKYVKNDIKNHQKMETKLTNLLEELKNE